MAQLREPKQKHSWATSGNEYFRYGKVAMQDRAESDAVSRPSCLTWTYKADASASVGVAAECIPHPLNPQRYELR